MGYLEWDVRDLLAHGERMSYRIPTGTEIFPYASESGEVGIGRLTTVELEPEDTAQRLTLSDPYLVRAIYLALELPQILLESLYLFAQTGALTQVSRGLHLSFGSGELVSNLLRLPRSCGRRLRPIEHHKLWRGVNRKAL